MLRYFYLLYLLICIEWTFCYDYISEDGYRPRKFRKDNKLRHRRHRVGDRIQYGSNRLEYGVEEGSPVAEIDVASFIQKPDYDAVEDISPYEIHSAPRKQIAYAEDYGSLSEHSDNSDQRKAKHNSKLNVINPNDFISSPEVDNTAVKSYNQETFPSDKSDHKLQKKCLMKHMKFPFFSHKKADIPKPGKGKKKKLSSLNKKCNKVKATSLPKSTDATVSKNKNHDVYKIKKRSYEQYVCPLCRRKYSVNVNNDLNERVSSNKLVHNSRQFYKDVSDSSKAKSKEDFLENDAEGSNASIESKNHKDYSINNGFEEEIRRKRYDKDDRDRQLKELEDVQKKVDGVEITSPSKGRYDVNN